MNRKPQLIVALDVDTAEKAKKLIDDLAPSVDIFKVGSQLFTATGPVTIRYLQDLGKKVFLDLKFHDILNTVANAVSAAVGLSSAWHESLKRHNNDPKSEQGLFMYTVHTVGGKEMLKAATKAGIKKAKELGMRKPLAVGVTVLTSTARDANMETLVLERAKLAKESGLDGVVASVEEAGLIRRHFGRDFIIVTPGIRPAGAQKGDQQRVATPKEAVSQGSDYLVVGRPIVEAPSPYEAAQKILKEIQDTRR